MRIRTLDLLLPSSPAFSLFCLSLSRFSVCIDNSSAYSSDPILQPLLFLSLCFNFNLLDRRMSIALDSNRIERPGFCHGMSFGSPFDSQESGMTVAGIFSGDRLLTEDEPSAVELEEEVAVDSSSSSSIGRDSDTSDGDGDSGEGEVQSSCKGPLDALDALEEGLPIKRGISKFYGGKSKSFTSLADAVSCSSIKEIVKPEDAYTRKRKNLLAHGTLWDKNRHYPPKSKSVGMSKRSASSRSTLALAASMSGFESKNNREHFKLSSPPPILCRPPLPPHGRRSPCNESLTTSPQRNLSPWRSFSLSDLQCAAATTPCITGIEIISGDKDEVS
ncbi:hypothetical protein RHMOL_Rhmol05G0007700 [Rhododendron molle]|uniref:Uncharacterized protein n=1 Tax=Rhododendron molle TaxID=49168 RepID=A0ACC0NKB6_RHOML|nr:hypothetical protein RHMOL_Rhmol05G0007700 [Rhododendron molle]